MKLISPQSLGKAAWFLVYSISRTLSIEERYADSAFRRFSDSPVIYVLWHGRMFLPLFYFQKTGIIILVSEHSDGEIITAALKSAGCNTIRGSTTRGGVSALAKLVKLARQGKKIAFTPDGPRGPRWHFQPGPVYLAAKTGLPVVPLTGSVNCAHYFKSWDSFQLPLPFSRGVFIIGEPYHVDGGLDTDNIEFHRSELERRLIALTCEADEIVGISAGR